MFDIAILAVILCVIPFAKYPIRYGNGYALKEHLFFLVGLLYLAKLALFGGQYAASLPGTFLLAYTGLCLASMLWASNVEQAWQDVPKWLALFALFSLASSLPVKTVMLLAFVPVIPFIAYGFTQNVWPKRDIFDKSITNGQFYGTIGNTNHTAAYLAPLLFVGIWLAVNVSPWFCLVLPVIAWAILRTKCYASLLGVIFGSCFLYPPYSLLGIIPVVGFIAGLIAMRKWNKEGYYRSMAEHFDEYDLMCKEQTVTSRLYYLIVAWKLFRKRPVFGWGLRSYRKEIYDCQASLNGKFFNLARFKDTFTAYPQRAHNDLAESLVELGSVGFLLMVGFMATVLYSAASSGNYILMAGIVCLIINGLFFYTLSTFSYVPWMVLAACASGSASLPISLPIAVGFILTAFLVKLGISYVLYPQLTSMWIARVNATNDIKEKMRCATKALELSPTDGAAVGAVVTLTAPADPFLAMHLQERAVHYFDGTMRAWGVWGRYGELQMRVGNWEGAKRSLKYATWLNPTFTTPKEMLDEMEEHEQKVIQAQQEKQVRMDQFQRLANGGRA